MRKKTVPLTKREPAEVVISPTVFSIKHCSFVVPVAVLISAAEQSSLLWFLVVLEIQIRYPFEFRVKGHANQATG